MKISELFSQIQFCYENNDPAMLWGPPGIGKTDAVRQYTDKNKLQLMDFRTALRDPTDIKGYPIPDMQNGVMRFLRDEELPRDGEGILFFDEMNSGTPAVQAACMQLVLGGRIGSYVLPKGWVCLGAGNRESDRGVTFRMPAPLSNRFTHFDVECDTEDWINGWALSNATPELVAFHRFRTDHLFTFNPKGASHAFGTPRSWAKTDRILASMKLSESDKFARLKGTVGDGEATEYWAFLKTIKDLPSIIDIRKNPTGIDMPQRPDLLYAITTMIASHTTPKDFPTLMKFATRLPLEFQTVYMKDVQKRKPELENHKLFTDWAIANYADVV